MEKERDTLNRSEVESAFRVGLSVGLPLMAVYLLDRLDLAVYAAFGALASLYGHSEQVRQRIQTQVVAAATLSVMIAVASIYAASQAGIGALAALLFMVVLGTGTLGAVMGWVPRGEIFFVLVLLIVASIAVPWSKVPLAAAVGASAAGLSLILTVLFARLGSPGTRASSQGLRIRAITGAAALDSRQHVISILVAAVAIVAAWLLAGALKVGHPFWAPVATAAIMPALGSSQVPRRLAQLVLGTLGGVAFAALLFSFSPGHLALVAIIVLCQAVAELFVAKHYGVALLILSPLAIGMSNISRGLPWPPLLADRLIETAVGAGVAVVAILAWSRLLPKHGPDGNAAGVQSSDGVKG